MNSKKLDERFKEGLISNIIQFVVFIIFGFLCGFLLMRQAVKDKDELGKAYLIFSVCFFSILGLIIFIVKTVKLKKSIKKGVKDE